MDNYKLIGCCGDCGMFNSEQHRCIAGAHKEGEPQYTFFVDCPLEDGEPKRIISKVSIRNTIPFDGEHFGCECGEMVYKSEYYCPFCGNMLDWSDIDV